MPYTTPSTWPWYAWLALGLGAGVGLAVIAVRWQVRHSLAKQLAAERRARTAERLAELGAMTGGLAHEIKNPLSTIGLNAQLLSEGLDELPEDTPTPKDAKQRLQRRLESLRRETERLRGILSDFLNYAGELRLENKPTNLNQAIEELADFFLPQAQQQGVRLRIDLEREPVVAHCDVAHLKQAVLNLMLNAVQAMARVPAATQGSGSGAPAKDATHPQMKELIIQTRRAATPDIGNKSSPASDPVMTLIRVIDTGPGIPPETKAKLFTPYFTTRSGGSGLGLATTKRVIEAMGGRISVESDVGKGAAFTIHLPQSGPGERT